jgi:hypothetical protein
MKRDMDEPVNIEADPEDALRVLLGVIPTGDEESASEDTDCEQE